MLNQPKNEKPTGDLMSSKPGSGVIKANLPHDFGAAVNNVTEREYASQAARNQDPGHAQTRSNDEKDGRRDAGVGVVGTGPGSGSAGDVDTTEVGLDGRGLAESIPDSAERDRQGSETDARFGAKRIDHTAPLGETDDVPRGGTVDIDRNTDGDNSARGAGADGMDTTSTDDPFEEAAVGEISRGESMGPGDSSSSSARR